MYRFLALLLAAALAPLGVASGASAEPAAAATNGLITYLVRTPPPAASVAPSPPQFTVYVANPDGSSPRALFNDLFYGTDGLTWAPDGSRYAYAASDGITTRRLDGSGTLKLTSSLVTSMDWTPDGAFIVYSEFGELRFVAADGSGAGGPLFDRGPDVSDLEPTVAPDGTVVFTRSDLSGRHLYRYVPGDGAPTLLIENADTADFSPDGRQLAYITPPDGGSGPPQIWIADANGSNRRQLTTVDGAGAYQPAWSPDGSSILFKHLDISAGSTVKKIDIATGTVTPIGQRGEMPSWQPVERNVVGRVWGQSHVDTAIAASQYNYANAGGSDPVRVPANAVVLSRDDTYLDALVGSALAIKEQAPLLITPRTALDPRVEREIRRILGPGRTVYLLGGELALAPAVANRLTALGYTVQRIWGQTHFDTAIAINRRITADPQIAIVTTGTNFYDALAAGAAAGANPGTVIVLSAGNQMPSSSAAYLNAMNPDPDTGTAIVTAGGPGDSALVNAYLGGQLPSWPDELSYYPLVGNNERDTALLIADSFFAAPYTAAVATNRTWFDALTGGAMIGANYGPLLITAPTELYPGVRDHLSRNSGNLWSVVMLGGPAALPDTLISPIGQAISLPGQWDYQQLTPTQRGTAGTPRPTRADHPAPTPEPTNPPTTITR